MGGKAGSENPIVDPHQTRYLIVRAKPLHAKRPQLASTCDSVWLGLKITLHNSISSNQQKERQAAIANELSS